MKIPEDKIEAVRLAADIVSVIGERVVLKKAGKNFVGLCPFHSEKSPSFSVSPDKQMFYCFGCGAGGTVFNFLMKMDGVSFPEAVRFLGRRYGIDLPERPLTIEERQAADIRDSILSVNQMAASFFQEILHRRQEGGPGRQYLKNRGIDKDTALRFGLGYVMDGWENLTRYLGARRVSPELMEASGLVVRGKMGNGYDRFRGRVMFPILDMGRRVIGFGGRVLNDDTPKYLNSPETALYHKGRSLYGIHSARSACRQSGRVFITEGYFDVITMHRFGMEETVAPLGTSLTSDHVRSLKGYAQRAILVFDSDAAGVNAARRSAPLFLEAGMDARVMVLPSGYDPDTFLLEFGADRFSAAADAAQPLITFLTHQAISEYGLGIEGRLQVIDAMLPYLNQLQDPVGRDLYIREIAHEVGVEHRAVLEKLRFYRIKGRSSADVHEERTADPCAPPPFPGDRVERQVVALMLRQDAFFREALERKLEGFFEHPDLKTFVSALVSAREQGISRWADWVPAGHPNWSAWMAELLLDDTPTDMDGASRVFEQFRAARNRRDTDLMRQIRDAEKMNDHERLLSLLKQKQMQARNARN